MSSDQSTKKSMLTTLSSALMSRLRFAAMAGLQFGGKRNLYEVFGYPKALRSEDLVVKYKRQDIAVRVVDMPPEETWARPPIVRIKSQQKWEDFVARVDLWNRIIQADKLCSFGPFSVLWIGLKGAQDRAAPPISSLDDILYVHAYGGSDVEVKAYEDDTTKPRYGQPTLYDVRVGPAVKQKTVKVHYSRIIHVVDRPLQGQMESEPRLAQVYNVLDDLLKVGGGSAETYWLTANRGMQADIDKDMEIDDADAQALSDELDEYQHQIRRFIRTRGVKINTLGSDVADPRGVFETAMAVLAGATSIPQRILTGSEAGQLASEQDRANWAQYIERRRLVFAQPYILRPILQKLEDLKYIDKGEAEKAEYEWPEAFSTNPLEEALIRASDGRAIANFSRRNQFGNPIMTDEEVRRRMKLPSIPATDETLPEAPEAVSAPEDGDGRDPGKKSTNKDAEQDETPPSVSQRLASET